MQDNTKVLHGIPMNKKKIDTDNSVPLEDVFKRIARDKRERNKRYRSWLGWFWKAHDWCWYTYWSIVRWTPIKDAKWFFQRGSRGWSDRDAWDVHGYLARITSEMTKHLANNLSKMQYPGIPGDLKTAKDWRNILLKVSAAFHIMIDKNTYDEKLWKRNPRLARQCDIMTHCEHVKVEEGWKLLRKWFYCLWD